ncbi:hypothetical protein [Yoonia tamlensis]|uniref:hypothetical protein n=1 Tax=Yoonia tamlensis TaxID=390270 RepID=UPI000B7C9864|nr:hypothetical protein [Yoonia tamlensis]
MLDVLVPYTRHSELGAYFREKIANYLVGVSGKFTFLASTKIECDGEVLSGTVYVLSYTSSRSEIKNIRKYLQNTETDSFGTTINSLHELADEHCLARATFKLSRSGKIEIDCEQRPVGVDDASGTIVRLLANQVFYFLKDMAHTHQHHDPSHDAITELTEHMSDTSIEWAQRTQQSLYRAVIRYKRFRNEKALFRASGILAYARSFEKSHAEDIRKAGQKEFNRDELNASLEVSRAEIKHFDQKKLSRTESIRNSFFALFGFIISVTFLARMDPEFTVAIHPGIIWATTQIAEKPLHTVAMVILISSVYSFAVHKNDPAEFELTRTAMRLLQGFRLRWSVLFNLLATAFFSWLCYLLLISAFF